MHNILIFIQLAAMVLSFGSILITALQRPCREQGVLQIASIAAFAQCAGYFFELTSKTRDAAMIALKLQVTGVCFFVFMMLRFVLRVCRMKIPRFLFPSLVSFGFLILLPAYTSEHHSLFYKSIRFSSDWLYPHLEIKPGVLYFVFYLVLLGCLCAVMLLCTYRALTGNKSSRRVMLIIALCAGLLVFLFTLYQAGFFVYYDPMPAACALCAVILILTAYAYRLFDVMQSVREMVVEMNPEALVITDENFCFLDANPAAVRLFPGLGGFRQGTGIQFVSERLYTLLSSPERVEYTENGRFYESSRTKIYDQNRLKGYVAWISDVTEVHAHLEKLIEMRNRADRASSSKSEFIANMSHEIRTPMNAIVGFSELLLQDKTLSGVSHSYVSDIKTASLSLLDIVNDILDISKAESGRLDIVPAEYSTHSLISEIINIINILIGKKPVKFHTYIQPDIPQVLYGDAKCIRQMLINLLNNAVKFTSDGYIALSVTANPDRDGWIRLSFTVEDTGIGIKEEDLNRLFQPFSRLNENRNIEGTGLGLALSRRIALLMDGDISVQSEYGRGSVFTVVIRQRVIGNRSISDVARQSGGGSSVTITTLSAPDAKALVVDDNPVNIRVTCSMLGHFGISADGAESAQRAFELIAAAQYDIVFMDHMMPEIDGIEAAKHIRGMGGEYFKQVPIIALTANAVMGMREMFLLSGFNDFLSKPVTVKRLENVLRGQLPPQLLRYSSEQRSSASDEQLEALGIMANGINIKLGLSHFGGDTDAFIGALETFLYNGERNIAGAEETFSAEDLKNYTIRVHGIKGVALIVGAQKLSEKAKLLEAAGQKGDISCIRHNHLGFIQDYRDILAALSHIFPEKESAPAQLISAGQEKLSEYLAQLQLYIAEFDSNSANDILSEIKKYDFGEDIKSCLETASEALRRFDYSLAAKSVRDAVGLTANITSKSNLQIKSAVK